LTLTLLTFMIYDRRSRRCDLSGSWNYADESNTHKPWSLAKLVSIRIHV